PANMNTSVVGCSVIYGAAVPKDAGTNSPLIVSPGSEWTVPVHSCASAVKALVKTVKFRFNGTTLDDLVIVSAEPKAYTNPQDMPLWAVEDLGNRTIQDGKPFWGLLGPSSSPAVDYPSNLSTISRESLYLPGYLDDFTDLFDDTGPTPLTMDNFPGGQF